VLAEWRGLSHNQRMFYGIIKSLSDRGFGFIEPSGGGKDVYFHAADVGDEVFRQLMPNQPVAFEFAKRDRDVKPAENKGPRAAVLKLIDRIPGGEMPPPSQDLSPRHHPKARQRKATWKRRIDLSKPETGSGNE
jgi:cold shock CspA family protein